MTHSTEPDTGPQPPGIGELAHDTASDRVGYVMGHQGGRIQLRPVGGGREWDAQPDTVEPADEQAELRARVTDLNAHGGWGK